MSTNDRTLLERWKVHQDASAFSEMVMRHSPMVHATCRRILRDPGDAEDLTQECFLRLANGGDHITESLGGWLHTVATRRAISQLRSKQRRREREIRYAAESGTVEEPTWDDIQAYVDECIAELPEKLRYPIVAHFLEGQTQSAIARTLDISKSAISRRVERGVVTIRKSLKRRGIPLTALALTSMLGAKTAVAMPPALTASLGKIALTGTWVSASAVATVTGLTGAIAVKTKIAVVTLIVALILGGWTLLRVRETPHQGIGSQQHSAVAVEPIKIVAETTHEAQDAPAPTFAVSINNPKMAPPEQQEEEPTLERGEITDPSQFISISGFVMDRKSNPIPGVTVLVNSSGFDTLKEQIDDYSKALHAKLSKRHHFSAVSDQTGAYKVSGIFFRGMATLMGSANDGERVTVTEPVHVTLAPGDALDNVNIFMVPGTSIEGSVVMDDNGLPVPDAVVAELGHGGYFAYTDDLGQFELPISGLKNRLSLRVLCQEHGPAMFPNVWVSPEPVELRMRSTARLVGQVTWGDGSPAVGQHVTMNGVREMPPYEEDGVHYGSAQGRGDNYEAITDERGAYEIEGIDTGQKYVATVTLADGNDVSQQKRLGYFEPGETRTWDYAIENGMVLHGTVRGLTSHAPLQNVWVRCLKDGDWISRPDVEVGEDGSYELMLFAGSGTYRVFPYYWPHGDWPEQDVHFSELYGKEVRLEPGDEKVVDLVLPAPYTISMRVIDIDDNPVVLNVVNVDMERKGSGIFGGTDDDGRFSWAGFPPGTKGSFNCLEDGYISARTQTYVGEPGDIFPEETIVLYQGTAGIEGIALDATGNALENTRLKIAAHFGDERTTTKSTRTGANGTFTIATGFPVTTVSALSIKAIHAPPRNGQETSTWTSEIPIEFSAHHIVTLGEVFLSPPKP